MTFTLREIQTEMLDAKRHPDEFPPCPWCGGPMDEPHPNCKAAGDEMTLENARLLRRLQAIIDAR